MTGAQTPMHRLLGEPGSSTYLLDEFPGASVAYSVRKLSSSYTGYCLKARRGGDNAELDFGFVNGFLDTAAMKSWGGSNVVGIIWYDQSGNGRNATNTTGGQNPDLIAGSTLIRIGSLAAIDFGQLASDARFMQLPTGFLNGTTTLSYFQAGNMSDIPNGGIFGPSTTNSVGLEVLQVNTISRPTMLRMNGTNRNDNAGAAYRLWDNITNTITTILGNSTDVNCYKNGSAVTLTSSAAMPALNYNGIYGLGQYNSATEEGKATLQEFIIWETDQTSNRTGIEAHINAYFSYF